MTTDLRPMTSLRRQAGFSLIEVLVSVVIMSVGILGVAGMQVISLQQNRSSMLRAEALQLGNDILDRMRVNPQQDYALFEFGDAPPGNADCITNACTPAQMRDYDIAQWICSINSEDSVGNTWPRCLAYGIAGALPEGAGAIVDNSDDALCPVEPGEGCVTVRWQDVRDGTTGSIALRTRIR